MEFYKNAGKSTMRQRSWRERLGHGFLALFMLAGMIGHATAGTTDVNTETVSTQNGLPLSNQIENIDYRRHAEGYGVMVVDFASPQTIVNVERRKKSLQVDILNTSLPNHLLYILDVNDFATVVNQIETFMLEDGARIVLEAREGYEYDYQLVGSRLELMVKALQTTVEPVEEEVVYTGEPISINFQDIPVRNVLQLVADYNDFNLVVSDSVQGNVTLRLDGVPWEQVLDLILQVRGLDKRVEGNVVLVAPKAELAASEQLALEAKQIEESLLPLETRLFAINFAKASDIAALLVGEEDSVSLLSARGAISTDERTNTLIVRDVPEQLDSIAELVESLDVAISQVQIEARIVSVDEGDLSELGVRWGFFNNNGSFTAGSNIETNMFHQGRLDPDEEFTVDDYMSVNLGATDSRASSIAFTVAKLGKNLLLDLELSALQAENKAEIVSSPRLMTVNKKPAYIEQGTEIPYLEAASSGAATIAFRKAVLSLRVIPQITPDGRLILDLEVTQDTPGETVKTGFGEAVSISTRRIDTQVMVEDGETVVLGGIFQHATIKSSDKVPLLGDLPAVGRLFRRDSESIQKREMLIFVTPQIVAK
ncbi:type IV pilus secretin PilQ [Thaumasiovibrio sp. DFM-14]|uniref:type IV pilus secretin PilQ n=1 Tax=Thaumasiovibrio sp. DFM-14 TaxID=3384792 RepID=UPI0039A3E2DF